MPKKRKPFKEWVFGWKSDEVEFFMFVRQVKKSQPIGLAKKKFRITCLLVLVVVFLFS